MYFSLATEPPKPYTERVKAQGDRVVQSWVTAAVGLLVIGMLWIVATVPTGGSPWFGLMLFGAGVLVGLIAYALGLIRNR